MRSIVLRSEYLKRGAIAYIQKLPVEKTYEVVIQEYKPTRTNAQNRLYWGLWLKEIADYTGYEKDELHEFFRSSFLPEILGEERRFEMFGRRNHKRHSTTDCNTRQFSDYLGRVERFANTEIGITLSHPMDIYDLAMYDAH